MYKIDLRSFYCAQYLKSLSNIKGSEFLLNFLNLHTKVMFSVRPVMSNMKFVCRFTKLSENSEPFIFQKDFSATGKINSDTNLSTVVDL